MRHAIVLGFVVILLAACGTASTRPPDLAAAQTEVATPAPETATTQPPTATPNPTATVPPLPSASPAVTASPSSTPSPSPTTTPTASPTATATPTPIPASPAADRVVCFNPGPGGDPKYADPAAALDLPDLVESPCCAGLVQLGRGGSLLLAFMDNAIVDKEGPDFEVVGESAGDDYLLVEVSPDGRDWYAYPTVGESSGGLDLAEARLTQAIYVRLTDLQPATSSGAEIDAVLALHSGPGLPEPWPALPDAVARNDLSLYQGPDKRLAKVTTVEKGAALTVLGRSTLAGWIEVEAAGGAAGWCPVSDLGLNVSVTAYPLVQSPPTPTPNPLSPSTAPAAVPQANLWLVFGAFTRERHWGWPDSYLVWVSHGPFKLNMSTLQVVELGAQEAFTHWTYDALSPDGNWVAESSAKGRNDGATELYVRRVDGSGEFKLVGDPLLHVEFGDWPSDSQWLAFRARQSNALGVANVQTREVKILLECPYPLASSADDFLHRAGCIGRPLWLPGGDRLVFTMWVDDDGGGTLDSQNDSMDIFVINRDGSGLRNLTNTPRTNEFVLGWSG